MWKTKPKNKIQLKKEKQNFIEKVLFSDEVMLKTFPNLHYIEADGTEK